MCLIASQPYNPTPGDLRSGNGLRHDRGQSALVWSAAAAQLLFWCTLCPTGAVSNLRRHLEVSLAFFSTFCLDLVPGSIMQKRNVPMLYSSANCASIPSLYLCHDKNILDLFPSLPLHSPEQPPTAGPTTEKEVICSQSTFGYGFTGRSSNAKCRF